MYWDFVPLIVYTARGHSGGIGLPARAQHHSRGPQGCEWDSRSGVGNDAEYQ